MGNMMRAQARTGVPLVYADFFSVKRNWHATCMSPTGKNGFIEAFNGNSPSNHNLLGQTYLRALSQALSNYYRNNVKSL